MTKIERDSDVFKWSQFVHQEEGKGASAGVVAALGAYYNAAQEKNTELQDENRKISYGFKYVYDADGTKREEREFKSDNDAAVFNRNKNDRTNIEALDSKFQSYMNALSHAPHDSQWHRNSADSLKEALKAFNNTPTRFTFNFSPSTLSQAVDRLLADPQLFAEVQESISPGQTRRIESSIPIWKQKLADVQPEIGALKY